jgi:hypothetical protein
LSNTFGGRNLLRGLEVKRLLNFLNLQIKWDFWVKAALLVSLEAAQLRRQGFDQPSLGLVPVQFVE